LKYGGSKKCLKNEATKINKNSSSSHIYLGLHTIYTYDLVEEEIGKLKIMTKKEYHQYINKEFYKFVNEHFPYYEIVDEDGGRIYLINKLTPILQIEYHRSQHYVLPSSGRERKLHYDIRVMENELEVIISNANGLMES